MLSIIYAVCYNRYITDTIILSDVYYEISRVVKARIARVLKARVRCGALTTSDISQYTLDNVYLSYASAHAHDSSNHSYVSMNMDSVNDRDQAILSSAPRYLSQLF